MPSFKEQKFLPYRAKELFEIINDINKYPKFVPWCVNATIISTEPKIAELIISYKSFKESYKSIITNENHDNIYKAKVEAISGPFKYLYNNWQIEETDAGSNIEFQIDFKFKSFILDKMIGLFFQSAAEKMIEAFELRAKELLLQIN